MAARRLVEREQAFVVAGKAEDRREIDLEELLGDGKRALPVETPPRAVGEDSPADPARRQVVHAAKVAEHLGGRRRLRLLAAPSRPAVERAKPALRFDDGETEPVAPPFADDAVGAALRRVVGEQQPIGNVLATARRKVLLTQARGPPESFENRPDQVFLGLALVGRSRDREIVEQVAQRGLETIERRLVQSPPVGKPGDRSAEKVLGEKTSLERPARRHGKGHLRLAIGAAAGAAPIRDADAGNTVGSAYAAQCCTNLTLW